MKRVILAGIALLLGAITVIAFLALVGGIIELIKYIALSKYGLTIFIYSILAIFASVAYYKKLKSKFDKSGVKGTLRDGSLGANTKTPTGKPNPDVNIFDDIS